MSQIHPDRLADNEARAREHLRRGDARLTSLPFHLHIESTTRCNAFCIICAKGHRAYHAEDLRPEVFEAIERALLPTAQRVNLTGSGEPLLSRAFDRFYDAAARSGARVYLVTNATLLTPARVERFARRPTDLIASIDGATAETFEAIRRPARFERVIESLRLYRKVRDIYPEAGSTLGINFVAMRRNIEELPALVDLAAELGAQFISVLDFATGDVPPEIAAEHLAASPELANRLFDQAAARAAERGIQLHLPLKFAAPAAAVQSKARQKVQSEGPNVGSNSTSTQVHGPVRSSAFQAVLCFLQKSLSSLFRLFPARRRFPQRCPDPWTTVLIATDGRVHPCCVSRRVMGDLNAQSAEAIWNGPAYRRFRRRIRSTWVPPECRSCNTHWGVNAGNPSAVRAREGLLIKALYRIEEWWRRIRRRLSPPPQPPPPNYAEGRPLREKHVHESHESDE